MFSFGKQVQFLSSLLHAVDEVLVVGLPDVGEHTDSRADDVLKAHHLVGFGDTSLEDTQGVGLVHLPHGERHAYLGIVALGATHDVVVGAKHLVEPFFDDGLAVTARDADDGNVELLAMVRG